ncbi:MAG: DUF1653 domain-containing protein [bacterium]|nr:DUF1653 domain-containing protein [bacterium]
MREIKVGTRYRHFKGHIYEVIGIAKHSETLEELVIYKNIKTNDIWARPINMFNSLIDKNKYPHVTGKYRFEEI